MKLSYPRLGWAEVRWDVDEDVEQAVADAAAQLSELPGVRYHVGPEWTQLDVPRNAWQLEAWDRIEGELKFGQPHFGHVAPLHLWHPKQPLYTHQVAAAEFLVRNLGGLCADQMGLGKTRVAIVVAQTLAADFGSARPRVIIAPGYTRDVWKRELLATGACKTEADFTAAYTRDPRDDAFNWDAPWWFIHYDIAHWWQGYMATRRPVVAILDEIHWVKNGRAKRSKAAAAIAGVTQARIGLTGTPISNRPAELWWPLSILDGKNAWGGPQQFRERYCGAIHDGYGLQDTGPTNTDELQERLETRYIRRTIDDAGVELPPLTRSPFIVPLTTKQLVKHDELVNDIGYEKLLQAITRGSAGQDTLARITKLRKLVSKAKLDATVQLATDMLESGESVVVFTWQKKTAETIMRALDKLPSPPLGWAIHGDIEMDVRDAWVRRFQEESPGDPKYIAATLGALREGVTLTAARHLILHDLDWVPANVLQAEARVYRIGQTKPTQVTWMLVQNSIDTMLARVLVEKSRVMAQTLGIDAAQEAILELDLPAFAGEASVDADIARLLEGWGV